MASNFITANVQCAWLALEWLMEQLAKKLLNASQQTDVVYHQRVYIANGVTMVMLGTDILQTNLMP